MRASSRLCLSFFGALLLSAPSFVSAQEATSPAGPAAPTPGAAPAAPAPPAPPASPNAAPADAESARDHFRRGEAAYQKGQYTLAIQEWERAYAADPRPRIQYNIYQARERLGQLGEAVGALQRYLSNADPDDPYYADATARMAALQQRLQATGIRLVGGVDGASINVSGHDWGRLPRPDRIQVQPGNHRVIVQLAGYRDFVSNVIVPAGQVVDVPVQLEALAPQATAVSTKPATAGAQVDSGSSNAPLYILSGVLAAGAVGSAIWMINRSSALDGCDNPANYCPKESEVETQRTIALGSTIALGAGAVGVLIAAILTGGDDASESATLCVPTLSGASCRMSF